MQNNQQNSKAKSHKQGTCDDGPQLRFALRPRCRGDKSCSAHAQEAETPVHKRENHRAKCDRTQIDGGGDIADDGRVYEPKRWHGRICENDWPRATN